jgi:hypothetical protein
MFFFNQMPRQLGAHKPGSDDNNVHQVKYSTARNCGKWFVLHEAVIIDRQDA